jgi:hypothetical protein
LKEIVDGSNHPRHSPETPGGIVGFGTIVIQENSIVTAVTKYGSTEFPDIRWSLHPARCFQIEIAKFLQLSVLLFG